MTAQALLAQDLLGTGTQVFGAPVGPTAPASLAVFVGAGRIYSMAPLEPSAWSSLAADATSILKQGVLDSAGVTIPCPVLGSAGQSTNYLIEGQFQENDTTFQTLSYWNASNPALPFSGAGNLGIAQPTIRAGQFVLRAKAGVPATTGTQTTPTVDAGWTAVAVVTVAFGATTIVSGNITQLAGIQNAGSIVLTGTGFSGTAPFGNVSYRVAVNQVTLLFPAALITGTSNAGTFTAAGLPAFLQPTLAQQFVGVPVLQDAGGTTFAGAAGLDTAHPGVVTFYKGNSSSAWTASGQKSMAGNVTYLLN